MKMLKRLSPISILFSVVVVVGGCSTQPTEHVSLISQQASTDVATSGAAIAAPSAPLAIDAKPQVIVLFVSDLHGRLHPDARGFGGYARIAAAIKQEKAKAGDKTDVIAIAGGSLAGKSAPPCRLSGEKACFSLLKDMGFDLGTLGASELALGAHDLNDLLHDSGITWTAANVAALGMKEAWTPSYVFKGPRSGAELIAVSWTRSPAAGEVDLKKARFELRVKPSEKDWSAWAQKANSKSMFWLSSMDSSDNAALLTQACSHSEFHNAALLGSFDGAQREERNQCAPFFRPASFGQALSRLVLSTDDKGQWRVEKHEFIALSSDLAEDSAIKAKVDALYKQYAPTAEQKLADVTNEMPAHDFAKWVAKSFRKATHADVTLLHMGAVQGSLRSGTLTEEGLGLAYPSDDELMGLDWSFKDMEKALCESSRRVKDPVADFGSDLVFEGAELVDAGTPKCKIAGPRRASYKLAMPSFLLKNSKRWLGKDLQSVSFRFQVKASQAMNLLLKSSGQKL